MLEVDSFKSLWRALWIFGYSIQAGKFSSSIQIIPQWPMEMWINDSFNYSATPGDRIQHVYKVPRWWFLFIKAKKAFPSIS